MTWAVIGGSGFVGSALTDYLVAAGEQVESLAAPRLSAPVKATAAALDAQAAVDPHVAELGEILQRTQHVVLAAGASTPDAGWSDGLVGANALLPAVVARACHGAGVGRLLHLSSAAVQGRQAVLDETPSVYPFSPYSHSKALGEQVLAHSRDKLRTEVVVLRATSVQGPGRRTTESLRRLARTPLASVAGDGSRPTAVSSIDGLCAFIHLLGLWPGPLPPIVLQPWEGLSTAEVLRLAGGKEPLHLPTSMCSSLLAVGWFISRHTGGGLTGRLRRVETMWRGQAVNSTWATQKAITVPGNIRRVLSGPDGQPA